MLPAHLALEQGMEPLQIKRQTDQTPLASAGLLATQRELAESHRLFDDADYRLDGAFAQAVDRFPDRRFEFVGHLHLWAGIIRWRCGQPIKTLPPTRMVRIAPSCD